MQLGAAYITIAGLLQEAATKMCHEDIRTRIQDALRDAAKAAGDYGCYIAAVFGDDKSGDVVFSVGYDNGLRKAPYTISGANCTIDYSKAVDVQPLTTYEVETDLSATEAGARNSKRDAKQIQAIHDAAAGLGANCTMTESGRNHVSRETLLLQESVSFSIDVPLTEAFKPSYQIKLIAPGLGSSAFYPAEVLKRDGPAVFKAGTPMRIDHPTRAEEAARPEGSVKDWGAVLAKDAYWLDDHAQGPGLYSEVKPFSDHVATIDEKGPYAGVSIRANGSALMEAGKPVMREGKPVLAKLHSAEGVDMVTRAGAGGMFLRESARVDPTTQNSNEGVDMDEAGIKKLVADSIAAAVLTATAPLRERALRGDAMVIAGRVLSTVSLNEAQKAFVIDNTLREALPIVEGALDEKKFGELLIAEAKRYAATIPGGARVVGMGAAPSQADENQIRESRLREAEALKLEEAEEVSIFESLGLPKDQAAFAAKGRAA